MSRFAVLTRIDQLDGHAGAPVEVDLEHVLWMDQRKNGTLLLMDESGGTEHPGDLINTSLLVAETEKEILSWVMD